ncbi:unnamed protein product [Cuscuta campestris]|uniref:Phytocyanin domain-containing protein n=1 Tax=Cuscuta campestris TaxID=132261 RepID=A0A484NBH4_9ASTE|nr:unnamed protein product [Cuscuta campestris]
MLTVGGKKCSWKLSFSSTGCLKNWTETSRFAVNDTLVWEFDGEADKVLEVDEAGYKSCNSSKPIRSISGPNAKAVLGQSGPHYFISATEENCKKGQKVAVVVVSEKHWRKPAAAPALSPAAPAASPAAETQNGGPAVAPTTGAAAGLKGKRSLVTMGLGGGFLLGIFLV